MIEVMGETMSDPVIDILLDPLDWLLFTSTNYFFCPPIVPMCICYFELWVCVVMGEIIIDKIFALIHKFGTPKFPDGRLVDDYWRLTSILHSSNNGYGSPQFYPVVMCDASCIDDPFQPQHVSIVHVVEIRRRNMFWNTVIVWRVSMLDGRQKKVHQFNHFYRFTDGQPFSRTLTSRVPSSCQSDGVMLIEFRDRLHVWDTRLDVSKSYDKLYQISGIQCVDRIRNSKGDLEGWRIRIISCNIELCLVEGCFQVCTRGWLANFGVRKRSPCYPIGKRPIWILLTARKLHVESDPHNRNVRHDGRKYGHWTNTDDALRQIGKIHILRKFRCSASFRSKFRRVYLHAFSEWNQAVTAYRDQQSGMRRVHSDG